MTKLRNKVLAALSAGTMLLSVVSPVAAATTTLEISGNGIFTDNDIVLSQTSTTAVVQSNSAVVTNNIDADAKTGNNDANSNTGGDVTINTGDAKADVQVSNALNSNSAEVGCCGPNAVDVLISGNGDNSDNTVDLGLSTDTVVFQSNAADVTNDIDADAKTGKNDANSNTGGDVKIFTGKATAVVDASTTANANWAQVGGNGGSQGSVDLRIVGNGVDSDNDIDLDLSSSKTLLQDNWAYILNDIDADAKTGKNDANSNTGGDVLIDTGDAKADVEVDNMVNFNWADVDCGCLFDVLAKVAKNGDNSDNTIKAELTDALEVFQDNCGKQNDHDGGDQRHDENRGECELVNDVDADAKTGKNDADSNTGDPDGGDPSIFTGDADALVDVSNSGNSNAYGGDPDFEWPDFDFNFNFSFDLSDLLALLGH